VWDDNTKKQMENLVKMHEWTMLVSLFKSFSVEKYTE
jgi:hypothetical protein